MSLFIEMLKGEIHRAPITDANLNYIGSLAMDKNLMIAEGSIENKNIQVLDITNGYHIETYIRPAEKGSGEVCINGASAHLVYKDDLVIILEYCQLDKVEVLKHKPSIVHLNSQNKITFKTNKKSILI
tara:strand:+ start:157 stop:540 length:384 start_codon:yes stop_codon:yes gene_type:complete